MTLGQQITHAERRARISSNYTTESTASDITVRYLNEGVREFCKGIGGLPKTAYLQLSPKFDVQSNWAMRVEITGGGNALSSQDIVLATANYQGMGGASMAGYLGTVISELLSVSVSVSWNSSDWCFTIYDETSAATAFYVNESTGISYVNAVDYFFNTVGTQSTSYFTGEIPRDCTLETDLPTNCLLVQQVEWNGNPLYPAPVDLFISPQAFGTPSYYCINGQKIRLGPTPESQEMFLLRYLGMETDLDATATTTSCPLPDAYHWAPIYYATHMLAEDNHDWDVSKENYALFLNEVAKYKIKQGNQNYTLHPRQQPYQPIKVVVSS